MHGIIAGRPPIEKNSQMNRFSFLLHSIVLMVLTTEAQAQGPHAQYERKRALWESHGFSYYSFVISMSCFCSLPADARVIVADNAIYDVVDPLSGEPARMRSGEAVMPRFADVYKTIDELFDRIESELDTMREARIAPTNDRSVVGVMNEFAFHGEIRWHEGIGSLEDLAVDLVGMPLGPLRNRSGFPDRELAAVLGIEYPGRQRLRLVGGTASPPPAAAPRVFQLKVTLKGTKPAIWRRVLVESSATLDQLHEVIQAAFGWWNYHLYEFEFGRTRYGIPDPDGFDFGPPTRDARKARLDQVAGAGSAFTYTYDFGDNWEHKVTVEKVLDASPVASLPACIDGRRAGPPEDCGGVWGYDELLAILGDPSHPEHAERAQWASAWGGAALDPDAFAPDEFSDNLRSLHLARFGD